VIKAFVQMEKTCAQKRLESVESALADKLHLLALKDTDLLRGQGTCMKLEEELQLVVSSRCRLSNACPHIFWTLYAKYNLQWQIATPMMLPGMLVLMLVC
jgi:hypothetical protein